MTVPKDRSELVFNREVAESCIDRSATCDTVLVGLLASIGQCIEVLDAGFLVGNLAPAKEALVPLLNEKALKLLHRVFVRPNV